MYVHTRIHEEIDHATYERIVVHGRYDRSAGISIKEKTDKRENGQRPTAELRNTDLWINCFPGRAYVFHYGSLIATHLALTGRDPGLVEIRLPPLAACESEVLKSGYAGLIPTPVAVLASGNDWFAPSNAVWQDQGAFLLRTETIGLPTITWIAVKHSFWGDIAYFIGRSLARSGFGLVVFAGKLGSLVDSHEPNRTLATGGSSSLAGECVTWSNLFGSSIHKNLATGRHVTLPSVLQESVTWTASQRGRFEFVDPEIGNMAAGVAAGGSRFSYLHMVSDNLSKKYDADLSNERDEAIRNQRRASYLTLKAILLESVSSVT